LTSAQFIKARQALGLSQAKLAKALDLSVRTVSGIETGERKVSKVVELAMAALGAAAPNLDTPTHRHVKTGGLYWIVSEATVEATMDQVVVYRSLSTGLWWTRPRAEFFDGRFEAIPISRREISQ
jgi:transcriptional regulator with XRE-family HTH domain